MSRFPMILTAISFSTICTASQAQTDSCALIQEQSQSRIKSITDSYEPRVNNLKESVETRARSIKEDAPSPDNPAEAVFDIDVDVSSHDEKFVFHLPSITMRDQNFSLDLPQVTMKDQNWSFDTPTLDMVRQCTQGIPELVCEGFDCRIRAGKEICIDTPVMIMKTNSVIIGVPEFKMDTSAFVIGVPELTWEEQTIILTIPDFTVRSISAGIKETTDASEALQASATQEGETLAKSMKSEIETEAVKGIQDTFLCRRNELEALKENTLAQLNANIEVFSASLQKAREVGAMETAQKIEASLGEIVKQRDKAATQLQNAIDGLTASMEKAMSEAGQRSSSIAVAPEPIPM